MWGKKRKVDLTEKIPCLRGVAWKRWGMMNKGFSWEKYDWTQEENWQCEQTAIGIISTGM